MQLTPGAAGMYCGSCMRDNTLVAAMRKLGHDVVLVPLYTPLKTDEPDNSLERMFFGGVNVFLQQKAALFRKTPEWLDRGLDNRGLINFATSFGIKTSPEDLGDLMLSMLMGEEGNQKKELDKLVRWLKEHNKPDVLCLSNVLLAGMARRLGEALKIPVVCTLQGEDFFLDGLPPAHAAGAWELLRRCVTHIDAFIPVSHYYGRTMQTRLNLPAEKMHVVHNGMDATGFFPGIKRPERPTIGYLARMSPEKGLRILIEAFKLIRARGAIKDACLRIAGSYTPDNSVFVDEIKTSLRNDGLLEHVEFSPNLTRAGKIEFLQSLSVFSVPASYGESFGLYVLEALACAVPVVQPEHGAFPELLQSVGGGILYKPDDSGDLAAKLEELLLDDDRRAALGAAGRANVLSKFTMERVAREVVSVFEKCRLGLARNAG